MASLPSPMSPIQFIDAALFCTSTFALSYMDPDQKWLIRKHLVTLLQDFPSLMPSTDTFNYNDGTVANLLNAKGDLHLSHSAPPIYITIWVHENYPYAPPNVYVNSSNPTSQVSQEFDLHHQPFVDASSGAFTTPYLQSWLHPRCNLSDLVHNLVKLLSSNHPSEFHTHPSRVSKLEAMDRLSCTLCNDVSAVRAITEIETEELSVIQVEVLKRADIAASMIIGLEHENFNLKKKVMELTEEADVLKNWLKIHERSIIDVVVAGEGAEENAFEAVDKESNMALNCLAEDMALEDLMYALDKAVLEGVVSFVVYIRQVRELAREQFFRRARFC
ncbi:hypothetical protein RJ640_019672 [Escallonia rubra]|uniref:Protein ELC-like n=1 Tax=Escallonia rubra TaxID=112253 RepID=A0AA88RDY7_9ASTE|nr:hypothetical protein RJ640_019672 [Escallonia rubra]